MTFDMCIYFETIIRIKVMNVSIVPLNFLWLFIIPPSNSSPVYQVTINLFCVLID